MIQPGRNRAAPRRGKLAKPAPARAVRVGRAQRGQESLLALAYDHIEDLIVHCRLAPGASVTTKELQNLVGLGRTPVHQAVLRLASETLIRIRPRDGLQISPIDLRRDRQLLRLRREIDRFVAELATERLDGNQRNRLIHLAARMRQAPDSMDVRAFNVCDRELNAILLDAAREPFLDRTLRPLHTISRRAGNVHLTHLGGAAGLDTTIECHLRLLEAVVDRDAARAGAASDLIVDFAQSMFDGLEGRIDPRLLDAS